MATRTFESKHFLYASHFTIARLKLVKQLLALAYCSYVIFYSPNSSRTIPDAGHVVRWTGRQSQIFPGLLLASTVESSMTEPVRFISMFYRFSQFYLIGAYLSPNDLDEWVRLAEIAIEQGLVEAAIGCYSQGIYEYNNHFRLFTLCKPVCIGSHQAEPGQQPAINGAVQLVQTKRWQEEGTRGLPLVPGQHHQRRPGWSVSQDVQGDHHGNLMSFVYVPFLSVAARCWARYPPDKL